MTASLYQSAVSGSAGCACATATSWLFSRNTEDMRRQGMGVELHEVALPGPSVVAGGDEIVQVVACRRSALEIYPARLRMSRIEIDDDHDQVVTVFLGVAKELLIVRRVKAQAPVALQRRIILAHLVQAADQGPQAVRPRALPALDLVLLGIEVFLAAGLARRRLHQLERRTVHAVICRQRARSDQAPADCQ